MGQEQLPTASPSGGECAGGDAGKEWEQKGSQVGVVVKEEVGS